MGLIKLIIFGFVGALILGIILNIHDFLDDWGLTPSQLEKAREAEEAEKARKEKERKDSLFNDWYNRFATYYQNIEGHILYGEDYDPHGQYENIWPWERGHPDDSRCEESFKNTYQNHISWLVRIFNEHIHAPGYFAIPTCISIMRCLREAYHNDASFNHAICILENLRDSAGRANIYLKFTQYGDCLLDVDDLKRTDSLDKRINTIERKLQLLEASLSSDMGTHYENTASNLPDIVEYSAELMWCIAAKKPFNQIAFDKAAQRFDRYTARCFTNNSPTRYIYSPGENSGYIEISHVEHLLALVYAKNQIGGQNTANQEKKAIMNWLDCAIAISLQDEVFSLPSALAWMGLYELERDVLRHLVEQKVNLPEELQDRLGFLESGGTSNIKIYDIDSDSGFLYDSSALEWNTDAFDLFFRKLEMTHKTMRYSLAISRSTKTLRLARGQEVTPEQLEDALKRLVADFRGEVIVSKEKAKALNLANVEYENSFIFKFTSERSRCVSILFSSEMYGRNLNLTIIVLFTPESNLSSEKMRKYALAIKDNIYVQSFQKSILQEVDEVIKPERTIYDGEPSDGSNVFE